MLIYETELFQNMKYDANKKSVNNHKHFHRVIKGNGSIHCCAR